MFEFKPIKFDKKTKKDINNKINENMQGNNTITNDLFNLRLNNKFQGYK